MEGRINFPRVRPLTTTDLTALLPLIILGVTATVVMVVISFYRNHRLAALLTVAGQVASLSTLPACYSLAPLQVTPLIIVDAYALFYLGLTIAASLVVSVLSFIYAKNRDGKHEEYYILLLLATMGSGVLVSSSHFASLFLGLELLTISLYAMIGYYVSDERQLEAGVKYLILAATSSAFLLFGMALVYAELGTMEFQKIASLLAGEGEYRTLYLLTGTALMVTGIGFKLAVVPFHMWTPDVYEGASAPVTAFLATVSKGGMFAVLLRYFVEVNMYRFSSLFLVFTFVAIASMFVGNLLAILQQNVKRILAYSSIAHLGYLLVAFLAGGETAAEAVTFYLVAYFVTTLGAFGIITLLSGSRGELEAVEDYRGLFWTRPWVAAVFTAMLLSLAGIPLTAGFIGKYFVIAAGVSAERWALVIILVVNSAIGLYYYLRIVVMMISQPSEGAAEYERMTFGGRVVLGLLAIALLWLGVYPAPLIRIIHAAVSGFLS